MLHLILGRDWTENRSAVLSRISRDIRRCQGNRILMVPELITHDTERRLCMAAGDTASRFAEVLSFTRLARRVADTMGFAARETLDDGGRVVAMAAAARQVTSRLKAYASVETQPEFLTGLIDGVDEFKRCCISPQDLQAASEQTEGSLAQKLEELSLLMASYDSLCSRGKRDPRDQMTWLLEQLEEGNFGQSHVFYIDGFPDFTRQNLAILEHLIRVSPSVTVSLNCDRADSPILAFEKAGSTAKELLECARRAGVETRIEVIPAREMPLSPVRETLFQGYLPKGAARGVLHACRAQSPYEACMDAARQVLALVAQGNRYRDIALVCTDMAVYQPLAELIFGRFHIPVYQSGTEEILQKNGIATVLTALDAVLGGFDQRSTLRYLRSALSPLSPDECDLVENYAILWGIRGQKWLGSWKNHPDGLSGIPSKEAEERLARLNEARRKAIAPLERLQEGFREAKDLRGQVTALYGFLQDISLEKNLSEMAEKLDEAGDNRSAQILNQLWEILLSALEQMYDVLGETYWDSDRFTRLLRLLLSQYDVGTIPPVLDAVQMGPVSAMRCDQQKHLILLGAEEGKLPGYTGSTGVLTDQERVTLREMGVPLTGGAMEGVQAEFAEIYGVFCGAMETIRVYCASDQPSYVFRRLAELAGGEEETPKGQGFALADSFEAGAYLARWNAQAQAEELGVRGPYDSVCRRRDYSLGKVERKTIRKLYGDSLSLSASQIDQQANCRLAYFLKYGMRAQERKEVEIDPAEFGTYVHDVLEHTCKEVKAMGGFHRVSLEQTEEIAHRFSEEYASQRFGDLDSQRVTYLFRRNMRELDMVVEELWKELRESGFEPADFEVDFGGEEGLPPIPVQNGQMNAILRGFIDRMDVWNDRGSIYYRVVDYKTGKKDFDYCDVFNGVGLQMLLYLFALRESGHEALGPHPVPAGVQYFPARAPYLSTDGRLTEEEAHKERMSNWKRRGLLLADEAVLEAMEPGGSPKRMDYSIKKDGSLAGDIASREQMALLKDYVFKTLAEMVEDIASGNVTPNPYTRGSSHDACAYCPYGAICHKATVEDRRNYKTMTAQRFWEEIGKEARPDGR